MDAEAKGRADACWMAQARRILAEADGTIVLRHLDRLHVAAVRALTAAVQDASLRNGPWIAVSVPQGDTAQGFVSLLRMFPSTVVVPPLRHHVEDVEQLVPFLLLRLGCSGQLTCSPEAMQVLLRAHWPGNVQQLLDTLRHVIRHRRTGVILASDLPPEIQSLNRRKLTSLESMKRDAIVLSLADAMGNKAHAARALGMSRATIYRKIHEYGIVSTNT